MSDEEVMDTLAIGLRIKAARERAGLTQAILAERVGVTRSAVAQWETGRSGQIGGNLAQIASVLGIGVEYLLLGSTPGLVLSEMAGAGGMTGDELALVRLYRECAPHDRAMVLQLAKRLVNLNEK